VLATDPGDLTEETAGLRLAAAAAGPGIRPGAISGGHWPLTAEHRGLLAVRASALAEVNRTGELAVYTLYDGQVVDASEVVARAKVIPFLVPGSSVRQAEAAARSAGGLVAVHPFRALAVGAVVQESLGAGALARFRAAFAAKVEWFGARLVEPRFVPPMAEAIAGAIRDTIGEGARIVVVAGSRSMDPLDPAFAALDQLSAHMERHGVPAHPGSLSWLARIGEIPVVGMPSCGLFSQATVFDLILPRLLAGVPADADWFAGLGHGGFLTHDMAFRFPAYHAARERGAVE
jgi:molybdopterin biosynthesis enzyme